MCKPHSEVPVTPAEAQDSGGSLDRLVRRIVPGGPYHLTIKTPEGYGFQCDWDDAKDFNAAIVLLALAVQKPGGIAAEVRGVVEMVQSPNDKVSDPAL